MRAFVGLLLLLLLLLIVAAATALTDNDLVGTWVVLDSDSTPFVTITAVHTRSHTLVCTWEDGTGAACAGSYTANNRLVATVTLTAGKDGMALCRATRSAPNVLLWSALPPSDTSALLPTRKLA